MIGRQQAYVDGKVYKLNWGHTHIAFHTEGEEPVSVPNMTAARFLTSSSLNDLIRRFKK